MQRDCEAASQGNMRLLWERSGLPAYELDYLHPSNVLLPPWALVNDGQVVVVVHDDVDCCVCQQANELQCLNLVNPEPGHCDDHSVMEHMQEGHRLLPQNEEYRVQQLIELGVIVYRGPKKQSSAR